jgi:hypothetical protein
MLTGKASARLWVEFYSKVLAVAPQTVTGGQIS